jgi:hypothetical protein
VQRVGEADVLATFAAAILGATSMSRAFLELVTQPADRPQHKPVLVDPGLHARYTSALGMVTVMPTDLFEAGGSVRAGTGSVGSLALVSLGAVNGGLLYVLRLAGMTCRIDALEPGRLNRSNLNRYLYAVAGHVGDSKVSAGRAIANSELEFSSRAIAIEDLDSDFTATVVVSGADNNRARWETQRRAPQSWVMSLETEVDNVSVSFFAPGGRPCSRCAHPSDLAPDPDQPTHPVVAAWAALIGAAALCEGPARWRPGQQVRLRALAPADRVWEELRPAAGCPGCAQLG